MKSWKRWVKLKVKNRFDIIAEAFNWGRDDNLLKWTFLWTKLTKKKKGKKKSVQWSQRFQVGDRTWDLKKTIATHIPEKYFILYSVILQSNTSQWFERFQNQELWTISCFLNSWWIKRMITFHIIFKNKQKSQFRKVQNKLRNFFQSICTEISET